MAREKKTFDLGDVLKNVLVPDTGAQEQIVYIGLDKLDADVDNFYSLDGLDDLAANIATVGLQQPLRVRVNPEAEGRYLIVSGHRRRAALGKLLEDDPERWGKVPCIVETPAASPELQELRLIFANADTRKMTSVDQTKQIERVEELLYKLKEQGYEFPGRMRDHVAQACKVSATKIATLKAIKVNLDKPLYEKYYKTGRITETVAYDLSKQPIDLQRRICDGWMKTHPRLDNISSGFVEDYAKCYEKFVKLKCPVQKGLTCTNCQKMLDKVFDDSYSYKPCKWNDICCAKCREYLNCKGRCPLMDDKAKAERAKKREASAAERAEQKRKAEGTILTLDRAWSRFGDALRRAGMTDKELRKRVKDDPTMTYNPADTYVMGKQLDAMLDGSYTEFKETNCTPFGYDFKADKFKTLVKIADVLDVSLDYLFLRDDQPRPERAAEPQPADAEDNEIQPPPVARWSNGMKGLPIDRPVLTWNLTNEGEVYRTAIWTGARFVDTKAKHKELTGMQFQKWIEIPEDSFEAPAAATQQTEAGALQFRSGTPDHDCVAWAVFEVEDMSSTYAARWKGGQWWMYKIEATIDAECIGWIELPDYEGVLRN